MAEPSTMNNDDGGPPGGTITTQPDNPSLGVTIVEDSDDLHEITVANEIRFEKNGKERKTNPIGARIKLVIINILTKYPSARISTMRGEVIKIETVPTDDDAASTFFDFDIEQKTRTNKISFGLRVATEINNFWDFKTPLFSFLKTNNVMMYEHKLQSRSVRFTRLGCLIQVDPNSVHLPTTEDDLNRELKSAWSSLDPSHKNNLYQAPISGEPMIPEVRLVKGKPNIRIGNQRIETSAICVECNAELRRSLLHLLPVIYSSSTKPPKV